MVTETTPETDASTPVEQQPTPEDSIDGDELLIAPEVETEAEPEIATGEGDAEKTGKVESPTEGEVETDSEPAEPAPEMVSSEELKKVQSGFDKQIAELRKQNEEAEAARTEERQRREEIEARANAQSLQVQEAQLQAQRAEHWRNQGHDEQTARTIGALEASYARKMLEFETQAKAARAEADQFKSQATQLGSRQSAIEIAVRNGVSDEDMPLLLNVTGETDQQRIQNMETMAKRLGQLGKQAKEVSAAKKAEVPAGGEANKLDSGGAGQSPLSDDQKLNDLSTPLEEIEAILERRGTHPFK